MSNYAFIFPGQGAQVPKMGLDFYEKYAVAREIFDEADEILKMHLKKVIFNGDAKELMLTKNSQPAIYVTSMAIFRVIEKEFPDLKASMTGGLSLGEYSALVAAQKASFEDVLKLVCSRGLFMHEASINYPGGMAAVIGLDEQSVTKAGYTVANVNCPGQVVISGTSAEIEKALVELKTAGARRVIQLDVSGAFHSPLMNDARELMKPLIFETEIRKSDVELVMNVIGSFVSDPDEIKGYLIDQVSSKTRWLDCINAMEERGVECYFEMGPAQLKGMNKKIGVKAETVSIQEVKDLEYIYETLRG